jgi:hypothetical protein
VLVGEEEDAVGQVESVAGRGRKRRRGSRTRESRY